MNPHNSETKKRKRKGAKASFKSTPVPAVASTTLTLALVEGTKLVAQDKYKRPTGDKLVDLSGRGYVKKLVLPNDSTPDQITAAVHQLFDNIPLVGVYGFRVLNVKKIKTKPISSSSVEIPVEHGITGQGSNSRSSAGSKEKTGSMDWILHDQQLVCDKVEEYLSKRFQRVFTNVTPQTFDPNI
ncbi:hypothetical protein R3P38DRAFT_2808106 [Favolaschia claudopus]|uniref:Uncharacterized protein n=1 Tax=Favolaschia claudopus TaxID=2862362 RepID=A0AAV9ZH50_9AGAR